MNQTTSTPVPHPRQSLLVVNLFGGPGAGKSAVAADVYAKLKRRGVPVELPPEVAKLPTFREDRHYLSDQVAVFAEQQHYLEMLRRHPVRVAVVDSPLLLSLVYGKERHYPSFPGLVREVFSSFENLNFFIDRPAIYSPVGRSQSREESLELDRQILESLAECSVPYERLPVGGAKTPILAKIDAWLDLTGA